MEAKKTQFRVRKPLSDCTNIVTKYSQSSTSTPSPSILKPPKPILSSAIIKLLNDDNTSYRSGPSPADYTETSLASSVRMHLAASTPPRLKQSSASNAEFDKGFEPQLSYSRRHTTLKRKITGKDVGMPPSCSAAPTVPDFGVTMKKRGYGGRPKRQLLKAPSQDASKKNLPQDFIDQQRLYFAEIDAFELLEEEVGSDEELG